MLENSLELQALSREEFGNSFILLHSRFMLNLYCTRRHDEKGGWILDLGRVGSLGLA